MARIYANWRIKFVQSSEIRGRVLGSLACWQLGSNKKALVNADHKISTKIFVVMFIPKILDLRPTFTVRL